MLTACAALDFESATIGSAAETITSPINTHTNASATPRAPSAPSAGTLRVRPSPDVRAGRATSTPRNSSVGTVTPGMSQSQSTNPCTSQPTAPANSATAMSRSRPGIIVRTRSSAAKNRKPRPPRTISAPITPVSARNCSGMLWGCTTPSSTWRYILCVTGNEPAPQPWIGLSHHAPAASSHHTQRLPEFDDTIRAGSETLS